MATKKKKKKLDIVAEMDENGNITKYNSKKKSNIVSEMSSKGKITDIAPVKKTSSKSTTNNRAMEMFTQLGNRNQMTPEKTIKSKPLEDMTNKINTYKPKTAAKKDNRTWFNKGAFNDGYQFGDVTKTLLGTTKELEKNLVSGALGIGEKTIDAGAWLLGAFADKTANPGLKLKTQKFIEKDLIDEDKIASNFSNQTVAGRLTNLVTSGNFLRDSSEENSLLGKKSEGLIESGGQLLATIGLQTVGVPWWITTGTTSFGGEVENAFKSGATHGEAGFSGLVTAGAEILTEKISGGISFGGKTLDSTLTKAISEGISNETARTLTRLGVDMTGEGAEEVLSGFLSNIGKKLSYEDEKTWKEVLASEEAIDEYIESFIGGAVLGGAGSSVNIIKTNQVEQIKKETTDRIKELESKGTEVTEAQKEQIAGEVVHEIVTNNQPVNASNTEVQEEIAPIQETTQVQEETIPIQEDIAPTRETTQVQEVAKENALERLKQLREIQQQATTEQQYNDIQKEINEVSKQVEQIQQQETATNEQNNFKSKQLEIIQKNNPMEDDYHTGIRSVEDIKTAKEVFTKENFEEVANPDFTYEQSQEALDKGKVKVYSSKPIEQGSFVSTSKMEAESYSGDGNVYEKEVNLNDIAWIENTQGQYAKIQTTENTTTKEKTKDIAPVKETQQDPLVMTEEEYLSSKGYGFMGYAEPGLHKGSKNESTRSRNQAVQNVQNKADENITKRAELRKEYQEKIESGEIRKPTSLEQSLKVAQGHEDNKSVQAARRLLTKRGIDWKTGQPINATQETTQEQSLDIAPIKQELNDLTNELKETVKDTKQELKSLKSDINEVKTSIEEARALTEADIPMIEQQSNIDSLTDNDIAPIVEDTTPEYSNDTEGFIESPFENRDIDEVGNRKVKAYQYENPEVRPYFKTEAEHMLNDLKNTVKGEKVWIDEVNPNTGLMESNIVTGTRRQTTQDIAYLKDNYNYTYAEIEKGLNAIIEDNGKENIAVAKRIEFMLDERLRNGYTSIDGTDIPANQDYINFLEEQHITEYNRATSETLTDEHAPIEDIAPVTENEIIARTKALQESSIENATENHPPLTDEFIEELTKQNIEMARESGKLKETTPIASNTEVITEIAPVMEQVTEQPTLKEYMEYEDPVMKAVENQVRRQTDNAQLENDEYRRNNTTPKKKTSFKERVRTAFDSFQSHFVNRNRQIDNLSKESGNAEIKFKGDRVNNISGEVGGDIYIAQTDNYGNVIGKSLDAPFEAARNEGLDAYFDNYLKHQSNIERHERGKGSKTVDVKTSQDYVNAYEKKYPQFKEWANDVYTYNQNLLNNAVQNGLIDEYFRDMLTSMYGKYVPFYSDNTEAIDPSTFMSVDEIKSSRPIKRAKGGSNANLLGIEQAMIQQTYAYKNSIAKNDLYKEVGSVSGEKIDIGADVRNNATDLESTLFADEKGKYLTYYENGKQQTVQISDELYTELSRDLEKQIRGLEEKYSLITKPLQKISQIRGQILTTYNPGFVVTNPFKDVQDALLNTKNIKGYLKNVINQSTIKDSAKGQNVNRYAEEFKALTGKDIKSVKDPSRLKGTEKTIYKDYVEGTMWNRFITSYGTNATSMEFGENGIDLKTKNKGFLNGIERANNYMEVMFRYPEFKATLQRGGSFTEALYNAREVTTNFGRGGTISKAINRNGATFFNTSIQGLDKFVRNFSGENGAKGFVGAVSKAVVLGMGPAILNHLLFGSGDEEDEDYEAIPNYVKDNYYLFKTGDGEFIRIPKGRMIAVLGSAARRSLEYADGDKDAFEGYLKNATDQVGATNPLKENIFSPLIQAYGSENGEAWYGGDLVPTRLQNKPASEQYDEGTDEFSKWLGEQLNISPYKLNYVIDQYTGGFGDMILPMMTEETKSGAEGLGTLLAPIKDKFTVNSIDDNKYPGEVYETGEELTINANSDNATDEDILKNKYLNHIKSVMGDLYQERREVQNSDLSAKEKYKKVQAIQETINELSKYSLDNFEDVEVNENYARAGDIEYYLNVDEDGKRDWYRINEDEISDLNAMGLTTDEKNSYFKAKGNISNIKNEYGDMLDYASENEKTDIYTDQKRKVIEEVLNANLNDYGTAFLYDRYYSSEEKLDAVLNANLPLDVYLDLEYQNFTADKDEYGKSISGSKKDKIINYIESTNLEYGQKVLLHKMYYPADDSYNEDVLDYVFNTVAAYEDRINILESLGFKVDENGVVHWD